MSSSVSLEASTSPTPPSHKMNGGLNPRPNLNLSALSASKHSVGGTGTPMLSVGGAGGLGNVTLTSNATKPLLDISRTSILHPSLNASRRTLHTSRLSSTQDQDEDSDRGVYQMLASLALLCLLSLLMSFLALFFLQRLGPLTLPQDVVEKKSGPRKIIVSSDEYLTVYQVSVALSTLTISLDLCCLFVCCIQFLFAIKLLKTPQGEERTHKFLKRSSHTRIIAIGGFFLSIPIFFTGVILFTFIHFHEVPAIATSIVIGLGIVFCGVASVQNVYLWQWEKTRVSKDLAESRLSQLRESALSPDVTAHAMELSTLV